MPQDQSENENTPCRHCGESHAADAQVCANKIRIEKEALKIGAHTAQLCSFCGQKHRGGKDVCQADEDETPVLPGRKQHATTGDTGPKSDDTPLPPGRRNRNRKHTHKPHASMSKADECDQNDEATVRAQFASPDQESNAPEDLVGHTLHNRYALLALIGKGGMSAVYKGKDLKLNRPVAVKVLLPHLMGNALSHQRFQVEAQAASSLSHPNLIQTHDFGVTQDGRSYLVMELLDGVSLAELLKQEKRLPLDRAVPIFIQICDALFHAHGKGVLHRDLKPSNIMITTASGLDFVRILDFGIAKVLPQEGAESMGLTRTGEVFGSPNYMSPEQCSGAKVDKRADIYSMGCLMYEVLAGQVPLTGDNIMETLIKQINEMPRDFRTIDPTLNIPQKMELIIFKALAKNPAERYASIDELGEALRAFQQNVTVLLLKHIQDRFQMIKLKVRPMKKREKALLAFGLIAFFLFAVSAGKQVSSYFAMEIPASYPVDKAFMPIIAPRPGTPPQEEKMMMSGLKFQEEMMRSDPNSERYTNYIRTVESIAGDYESNSYFKEAAVCYENLLQLYTRHDGKDATGTRDTLEHLADCNFKMGKFKEAAQNYQDLLQYNRSKDEARTNHSLALRIKLATALYSLGEYSQALPEFQRAARQMAASPKLKTEDLAITNARMAECYRLRSLWREAISKYESASEAYRELLQEGGYFASNNVSETRSTLASFYRAFCLYKLDKLDAAATAYKTAIPQLKKLSAPGRELVVPAMLQYADILWRQGKLLEALETRIKAREFLNMYGER